jgi:HEAT repeat protein
VVATKLPLIIVLLALPAWPSTDVLRPQQEEPNSADDLVRQLGAFPASLPASARSDGSIDPIEQRRQELYARLRALGQGALPALARGLANSDIQIRRNAALFLNVAAGSWSTLAGPKLDIQPCLPELITALHDVDPRVRALAAQAIGEIGPMAASAVPGLVALLGNPDEGSRNSACIGLTGIGPAAREALPALQRALSDPSPDVRRFAQRAIAKIDVR